MFEKIFHTAITTSFERHQPLLRTTPQLEHRYPGAL